METFTARHLAKSLASPLALLAAESSLSRLPISDNSWQPIKIFALLSCVVIALVSPKVTIPGAGIKWILVFLWQQLLNYHIAMTEPNKHVPFHEKVSVLVAGGLLLWLMMDMWTGRLAWPDVQSIVLEQDDASKKALEEAKGETTPENAAGNQPVVTGSYAVGVFLVWRLAVPIAMALPEEHFGLVHRVLNVLIECVVYRWGILVVATVLYAVEPKEEWRMRSTYASFRHDTLLNYTGVVALVHAPECQSVKLRDRRRLLVVVIRFVGHVCTGWFVCKISSFLIEPW
ncbi:hypothetical protein GTA08_BOTSDO08353 [Botryosphaeria dothidea]|uniref:Uncharacterized protein n=1 Tax=Botryosphaeria dothidea TaxID=55169 RepID=A0A8H4N6D9_9PEZI|nr:hypothetical protein GTA08_BOTSDO08353 [Botryosphaeria dothidea]